MAAPRPGWGYAVRPRTGSRDGVQMSTPYGRAKAGPTPGLSSCPRGSTSPEKNGDGVARAPPRLAPLPPSQPPSPSSSLSLTAEPTPATATTLARSAVWANREATTTWPECEGKPNNLWEVKEKEGDKKGETNKKNPS